MVRRRRPYPDHQHGPPLGIPALQGFVQDRASRPTGSLLASIRLALLAALETFATSTSSPSRRRTAPGSRPPVRVHVREPGGPWAHVVRRRIGSPPRWSRVSSPCPLWREPFRGAVASVASVAFSLGSLRLPSSRVGTRPQLPSRLPYVERFRGSRVTSPGTLSSRLGRSAYLPRTAGFR